MRIAYTMAPGRGDTDLLLYGLCQSLSRQGFRVAGTVQINTECAEGGPCDMDVKVLPDGPILRISQSLGRGARGCRLDPSALEEAVGLVDAELQRGADCLVINKFGKHEADGRGFRPLIATALSLDIPVIVGLNSLNEAAFQEFSGGLADALEPSEALLSEWLTSAMRDRRSTTQKIA